MGIDEKRLRLEWISASEGRQFADLANEMTETLRDIGPANIKEKLDLFEKPKPVNKNKNVEKEKTEAI